MAEGGRLAYLFFPLPPHLTEGSVELPSTP